MANENTVLTLSGIGVPLYSARGLQQSLEPIDASANLRRTINGTLIDLSAPQMRKYRSQITGSDQRPPACDGLWPGREVTVDCIAELCHAEYGTPARPMVPDSDYEEAGFVFYRPRLVMLVTGFNVQRDEWQANVQWTMTLEEK